MGYQEAIKEAETQIDMYEGMILYNKDFEPKNDNSNYERKVDFLKTAISAMQELENYKKFGALKEVRESVEKQRKKRPEEERIIYTHEAETLSYHCPCCKFRFINKDDTGFYSGTMTRYCPVCGQKIDWSE